MSPLELIIDRGHRVADVPGEDALRVRGLTVAYGAKPAVFSVDLTAPEASMMAIIGPNGAGKSTFLKGSLGIIPTLAGSAQFFGQPLKRVREKVAYVPQRASVDWDFPARVEDVVTMGLYRRLGRFRLTGKSDRARVLDCLDRVGMADFSNRQIGQLSGGQQQRVFLARALAQDANLYLLDEPFAGVDVATESAIVDVMRGLKAEGKTVVAVHHDLTTVRSYFDRVALINLRKIAEGPVETSFTSETLQETYGGRLADAQIATLQQANG